eukprot:TRINITY_DN1016_c0_g1_i2.p1 TRINITY_DN1016_c0_g1~~TRINITY_DN1016_c0_g1_i2.p1  ORF type:complete len:225 (+),score=22.02 TRINITY_DN1016_c0_g1_i2:190-864(+)
MKSIISIIAIFACLLPIEFALSNNAPLLPSWPTDYEATVFVISNNPTMMNGNVYNWYFSQSLNKDRLDGMSIQDGIPTFTSIIVDHNNQTYTVAYHTDLASSCVIGPVNWTLAESHFDFTDFEFGGKALVGYEPAFYWFEEFPDNTTFGFFNSIETGKPLRVDISDPTMNPGTETFLFPQWDNELQDPSKYEISENLAAHCSYDRIPPFAAQKAFKILQTRPRF